MNEITVQEKSTRSAAEVKAGLDLILQVMKTSMEKDKDYGVIPGCKLPSLWKPGSEKILTAFRIGVDPEVENLSNDDEAHFIVKARLFHGPTGIEVGKGIGEASSHEEKYKWRKAVCEEEFAETAEDRKRIVWKKGQDKNYQVKQVRTNKADVSNTILKMAKKRAQIDGTLTATAASAVFTQDLEDLEAEVRESIIEAERGPEKEPIKPAEKKTEAEAGVVTFVPVEVQTKQGKGDKGPWTKFGIKAPDGKVYGTFDENFGALAEGSVKDKLAVTIQWFLEKGKYLSIKAMTPAANQ